MNRYSVLDQSLEWGKADPSGLTKEELDRCVRLDMTPERYAWLKTCPKGGNIPRAEQGTHELLFNLMRRKS